MRGVHCRLKQGWILLILCLLCSSGCTAPIPAPAATGEEVEESPTAAAHILRDVRVSELGLYLDLEASESRFLNYRAFKTADPLRLVVDLFNTLDETVSAPLVEENTVIGNVETMMLAREPDPVTRVEIGLKRDASYIIDQEEKDIRVTFHIVDPLTEDEASQNQPAGESDAESAQPESDAAQEVAAGQPPSAESVLPSLPLGHRLPAASKILAIQPREVGQKLSVSILTDGSIAHYSAFHLTDPPRLVVDLLGVQSTEAEDELSLNGPLLKKIRVGLHDDKVRVVFDLIPAAGIPYHISPADDRLVVSFGPGSSFPSR